MTLELKSEDASLGVEEQKQKAIEYVYGSDYQNQNLYNMLSNDIITTYLVKLR